MLDQKWKYYCIFLNVWRERTGLGKNRFANRYNKYIVLTQYNLKANIHTHCNLLFISNTTETTCKILAIVYRVALSTISWDSALWFVFSSIAHFLDLRVSKRSFNKFPGSILGSCLISPERKKKQRYGG